MANWLMGMAVRLLDLAALLAMATAFEIKKYGPTTQYRKEGDTVSIKCTTNGYWEWCTFKHLTKECQFTADHNSKVSKSTCSDFKGRDIKFYGDYYYKYECGMELTGVTPEDAGDWSCTMDEYYDGSGKKFAYSKQRGY